MRVQQELYLRVWSGAIEVASFWACTGSASGLRLRAVTSKVCLWQESVRRELRDDIRFATILSMSYLGVLQPDLDIYPEVAKHLLCYCIYLEATTPPL